MSGPSLGVLTSVIPDDRDDARPDRELSPAPEAKPAERVEAPPPAAPPPGPLTVGEILDGASSALDGLATSARRWIDRGRYRKVRISRKGKQVLPDIPVAAMAAIQAATLFGGGLGNVGKVLAVNVGARFLFDVEVINTADELLEAGRKAILDGDLETAEVALKKAVRVDDRHAEAALQLGIVYRLCGERDEARACFLRAIDLDQTGDIARRARGLYQAVTGEP